MPSVKGRPANSGSFKPGKAHPAYTHGLKAQGVKEGALGLVPKTASLQELGEFVSDLGAACSHTWRELHEALNGQRRSAEMRLSMTFYAETAVMCKRVADEIRSGKIPPAKIDPEMMTDELYEERVAGLARDCSIILFNLQDCAKWLAQEGYAKKVGDVLRPTPVLRKEYGVHINRAKRTLATLASYIRWRGETREPEDALKRLLGDGD